MSGLSMESMGTFMCLVVAIMALLCFGHGAEYCALEASDQHGLKQYIREGRVKRLYPDDEEGSKLLYPDDEDDEEGSKLCFCKEGANLECTMLPEIKKKPCSTWHPTPRTYYLAKIWHGSPLYGGAYSWRKQCLCYSGEFICAKPPKGKNKIIVSTTSRPGVLLYLGFSKIDFNYLKNGRIKLGDKVPLNMAEEEWEVRNTIQQTVSNFISNTSKTECRISQEIHTDANYVFKATLDEYDEYRRKKNMSDYMKWREKDECYEALESIVGKVNIRDADIRSHIVLSMFKAAHAEANVPSPPPSSSFPLLPHLLLILLAIIFLV